MIKTIKRETMLNWIYKSFRHFLCWWDAEPASLSADKTMTARADIGLPQIHDIGLVQFSSVSKLFVY